MTAHALCTMFTTKCDQLSILFCACFRKWTHSCKQKTRALRWLLAAVVSSCGWLHMLTGLVKSHTWQPTTSQRCYQIDTDDELAVCMDLNMLMIDTLMVLVGLYIVLLSALEPTHCAFVTCNSEWVTNFLFHVLNIHQSGVLTVLFGRYMVGDLWNCCHLGMCCVHHTTCLLYTSDAADES